MAYEDNEKMQQPFTCSTPHTREVDGAPHSQPSAAVQIQTHNSLASTLLRAVTGVRQVKVNTLGAATTLNRLEEWTYEEAGFCQHRRQLDGSSQVLW